MEKIVDNFKTSYSRGYIINCCMRDKEYPIGIILTLLRDYYNLPKTKGWSVAEFLLDYYRLRLPKDGNKRHAMIYEKYCKFKGKVNQYTKTIAYLRAEDCFKYRYDINYHKIVRRRYLNLCAEYKQKIYDAQKEYNEIFKLYDYIKS